MSQENLNERETQGSSETQADGAAQPDANRRQTATPSLIVDEHKQTDSKFTLIGWDISVRGIIALLLVVTVCVLSFLSLEISQTLHDGIVMVLSLYFVKNPNQNK